MDLSSFLNASTWALLLQYLVKIVGVLFLLFAAWVCAAWVRRLVRSGLERGRVDSTLTKFFSNFARYTVLVIAMVACLGIFGIETTSFAAVLAAAGFAIGLAFQGTLSNFASGVMLLVFRPFRVGDVINVNGILGKVDEIELFSTQMDTFDNRRMILPNSSIFGSTIENITYHPKRRVDVPVGTEYVADLDQTRAVLEQAALNVAGRMPDEPTQVVLNGLGDSSINWEVRVWAPAPDFLAVKQQLIRDVKVALDGAGIGIPFPQMDVHLDPVSP